MTGMTGVSEVAVCVGGAVVGLVGVTGDPPPLLWWGGRHWVYVGCRYECLATWANF